MKTPMLFAILLLTSSVYAGDLSLISIPSAETTGYPGSPMLMSVTARSESGQAIEYQWKKDGKELSGETSSMLQVKEVRPRDAGVYSVVIKTASENMTAQSKVVVSKTKLPKSPRKPAAEPQAASCHDSAAVPKAPSAHDHHKHH